MPEMPTQSLPFLMTGLLVINRQTHDLVNMQPLYSVMQTSVGTERRNGRSGIVPLLRNGNDVPFQNERELERIFVPGVLKFPFRSFCFAF